MRSSGKLHFQISEEENSTICIMPDQHPDQLFIVWNMGEQMMVEIDQAPYCLEQNCIIFISEFHMSVKGNFKQVRLIQFDKAFLGLDQSMNQIGDYLLVFYGYHYLDSVPKIQLNPQEVEPFHAVWENIKSELKHTANTISTRLIQNAFQRLLLLAQKTHAKTEFDLPIDAAHLRIIREFQYLVETHFKQFTKVANYAEILKISAKKLAETFHKYYHRTPSELIAHRRNLYAQKQLIHSEELIKNIAYELNFSDSQAFSHFFKKMNNTTPDSYRKALREEFRNLNTNESKLNTT